MEKQNLDALAEIFTSSKRNVGAVLCEVRSAIEKLGLDYSVQSPTLVSDAERNDKFFDWIVFREYGNHLQYLKEILPKLNHLI